MKRDEAFLRALGATLSVGTGATLDPERVNLIGEEFALSPTDVYTITQDLKRQGLVDFLPGAKLFLTEEGRRLVSPALSSGNVAQTGSWSITNSPGASVVVGTGSSFVSGVGPGASGQNTANFGPLLSDLAAVLAELRELKPSLEPEEIEPVHELEAEVSATMREVAEPGSTGTALEAHIAKVHAIADRFSALGEAGEKIGSIIQRLEPAWVWARSLIGG